MPTGSTSADEPISLWACISEPASRRSGIVSPGGEAKDGVRLGEAIQMEAGLNRCFRIVVSYRTREMELRAVRRCRWIAV